MNNYSKYYIDDSEKNYIYIADIGKEQKNDSVLRNTSTKDDLLNTGKNICKEISKIKPVVMSIVNTLTLEEFGPSEIEVELGVGISSNFGAVIVSGEMESTFKIKAVWKKDKN